MGWLNSYCCIPEESLKGILAGDCILIKNRGTYKVTTVVDIQHREPVEGYAFCGVINRDTKRLYTIYLDEFKDIIIGKVNKDYIIDSKTLDLLYG